MPWKIIKSTRCPDSKPFALVNSETGRLVACHASQESARKQQKALYARVPESRT